MSNLVNEFCKLLDSLPPDTRARDGSLTPLQAYLYILDTKRCDRLAKRQGVVRDKACVPAATTRDIRRRISYLSRNAGVFPSLLVVGLLHELILLYTHLARPESMHAFIDSDLAWLQTLSTLQGQPSEQRHLSITDEQIREAVLDTQDRLSRRPANRQLAEEILERLEAFAARLGDYGL